MIKENLEKLSFALDKLSQIECLLKYQNLINEITIKAVSTGNTSIDNPELDGLYLQNLHIINKISNLCNTLSNIYKNIQN